MIQFRCPDCNAEIEVSDHYAGRAARCPTCDHKIRVPAKENGDRRTESELLQDASATSSAVFRLEGRLYQARPKLEGTLIAAALVMALSLLMFLVVGLTIGAYSPWLHAGAWGAGVALFGALLVAPAMYNIRRSRGRKTGRRLGLIILAVAAMLVVFYGCAVLVAVALADNTDCRKRLDAVYQALKQYAAKNDGCFPPRPETLVEQGYLRASKLTCPDVRGAREGTPTYLPQSWRPQIDFKTDLPFPGDLIILMDGHPHEIQDSLTGKKTLGRYFLQLDGTVRYCPASLDPKEDEKFLSAALRQRELIVARVLKERRDDEEQRMEKPPAPPPGPEGPPGASEPAPAPSAPAPTHAP